MIVFCDLLWILQTPAVLNHKLELKLNLIGAVQQALWVHGRGSPDQARHGRRRGMPFLPAARLEGGGGRADPRLVHPGGAGAFIGVA